MKELNTVYKDLRKVKLRIALCFPSTYEASIRTLTIHLIYFLLNSFDHVFVERCVFTPRGEIRSIETGTLLKDFDVIAFSISYELDYARAINMLIRGGVKPRRKDREAGDPIIVAGGPAIIQNPIPLEEFFDFFFIGELEDYAEDFIQAIEEVKEKRDFRSLEKYEFLHIPSLGRRKVKKAFTRNLNEAFYPVRQIQPLEWKDFSFLLEIGRGCGWGCRFCLAGFIYRPPRFRSLRRIMEIIEIAKSFNKFNNFL